MSKTKSNKKKKAAASTAKGSPKKSKVSVTGKKPKAAPKKSSDASAAIKVPKETKLDLVIELLSRPDGATIDDIVGATGWKKHTVRACISHALAKKRGYKIISDKPQGGTRSYKIEAPAKND